MIERNIRGANLHITVPQTLSHPINSYFSYVGMVVVLEMNYVVANNFLFFRRDIETTVYGTVTRFQRRASGVVSYHFALRDHFHEQQSTTGDWPASSFNRQLHTLFFVLLRDTCLFRREKAELRNVYIISTLDYDRIHRHKIPRRNVCLIRSSVRKLYCALNFL